MRKVSILVALILFCTLIKAQSVRSLYEDESDEKDELADFSLKDINSLEEVNVTTQNGEIICMFKHANWIDSSKFDSKTNYYTFWRNKTILVEGYINPNKGGSEAEGGLRKGIWVFRYDNGDTLAIGKYDNSGNKIDKWISYYPNQQTKKVENYLLYDTQLIWDIDSNKTKEVLKSKKHGEYLEYYENGQIKIQGKYKSEIIQKDSAYSVSYQEHWEVPMPMLWRYTKGFIIVTKKTGKWFYYDEKGILRKEEDYN